MRVVIVGGGSLGYHLALSMLDKDYEVNLIEKDKNRCSQLANLLDAEVICLVASQLAQKRFQIKKVITRANNPGNLEALRKLGMTNAVCSTELITRLIEQELDSAGGRLIASLNKGRAAICELQVLKDSKVVGQSLKDIILPKSSLIISLFRDDELIIPEGNTTFLPGDEVVAICANGSQKKLIKIFSER